MEWDDFLATEAATHGLSPEQTAAFLIRLKTENSGKSEAKLASDLNIGVAAFKKRMTEVYDKFAQSCPELANSHRGKLEKLLAWLTAKYNGVEITPPTIKVIHHNLPPAVPFEKFVGREEELQNLHQQLQTSQQVVIVAVAGMGGVGKTELATQYAKQHLQNYPGGVCWLSAQGIDVGIQILRFAELKFNLIAPDDWELIDRVKYCWEKWEPGEVLLVFDNVTDYKQVQRYQPESSRFKLLLTTRFGFDSTLQQLPLGVLKPLAAMKLLKLLVGRERLQKEAWVARKICKFLGYLPLALELVGRYLIKMPDLSLETLLKRLNNKRLEHEAIAKANPLMRYEYGVAEAFELSWEQLDGKAQIVSFWLSLYALADIPFSVEGMGDDEEQEVLEKAIRDLRELHLLERINKGIYRLHPLIRQFFQMKLDETGNADEVKTAFVSKAIEAAKVIPPQPTLDLVKKVSPFIPHIAEVANYLTEYISDEDLFWIFTGLGRFYGGQGFYEKAEPWFQQCRKVTENRLGSEHLYVAASLNSLAELYHSTGRYSEAEPLYLQDLELSKRLVGDNHPSVTATMNNLAEFYHSTGRYSKAEPLYLQVLELTKHQMGDNHPDVATSLNNLARFYYSTERYSKAEPLYLQALEIWKCQQIDNNPDVAIIMNNLADLYKSTGRYNEAETLYRQVLENIQHLFGDNHPHIANSINNLADLYFLTGRYSEAESMHLQALELAKRFLGDNHPHVAISMNNLALLYEATGRYSEAELLYLQALAICECTLGIGDLKTMTARGNYARFLREAYR